MTSPIDGNKFAEKYKTDEEKICVFVKYCEHIASGFSKESFVPCDYRTIESYIKQYPDILQSEKMEEAYRKNRFFWEEIGHKGCQGKIKGFDSTSWIFNICNRFPDNWKRKETHELQGDVSLNVVDFSSLKNNEE